MAGKQGGARTNRHQPVRKAGPHVRPSPPSKPPTSATGDLPERPVFYVMELNRHGPRRMKCWRGGSMTAGAAGWADAPGVVLSGSRTEGSSWYWGLGAGPEPRANHRSLRSGTACVSRVHTGALL